jgi:hypothetical protein
MEKTVRIIGKTFAALTPLSLLSLLAIGASAAPASAASGCYGYSCHGYDLYHFGCTYSSTVSAAAADPVSGVILAYVYNRYSAGCNANWSEAQLTPAGYAAGDTISVLTTTDSGSQTEDMYAPASDDNRGLLVEQPSGVWKGSASIYTDMVDGTNLASSYVEVYHGNSPAAAAAATQ